MLHALRSRASGRHRARASAAFVRSIVAMAAIGLAQDAFGDASCVSQPAEAMWSQIVSDPYTDLPRYEVNVLGFGAAGRGLTRDSRRTLESCADFIPTQQKRVHANGICMLGTWRITEDNPFSGFYRRGSEGTVILRASVANGWPLRGQYRFYAMAGKLFGPRDRRGQVRTANWFTLTSPTLGLSNHFLDAELTNDIFYIPPPLPRIPLFRALLTGFQTATVVPGVISSFVTADRALRNPTRIAVRQLYPVAELGEAVPQRARSPQWMKIEAPGSVRRVNEADFRDELRVENYPRGLRFDVSVADIGVRIGPKAWRTIGQIEVTDTVTSLTCDQRLHFGHPQWRRSLGPLDPRTRTLELVEAAGEWSRSSFTLLGSEDGIELALAYKGASIEALRDAAREMQDAGRRGLMGRRAAAAENAIALAEQELERFEEALVDAEDPAAALAHLEAAADGLALAANALRR